MIAVFIWILCGITGAIIVASGLDVILKVLLLLPLLCIFVSGGEVAKHRQVLRWERTKDSYKRTLLERHNKIGGSAIKYIAFVFKAILYATEIWGFYQWFDRMYSHYFWIVIHLLFVAVLLAYNLYVDTFEGKWYHKINITIIKDDFVQRKIITMLFLAVFVSANAFIVFI